MVFSLLLFLSKTPASLKEQEEEEEEEEEVEEEAEEAGTLCQALNFEGP